MSASIAATESLTRLLDAVDDRKLQQVLQLVEASGQRRRLEPALAALRPRLRRLRPRRPLTLPRLLTVPFEAVLVRGAEPDRPFSIARNRLGDWHERVLAGLDPATARLALSRIDGRSADDRSAIADAGMLVWPAAAGLLAADALPGERPEDETARHRAADLSAIAVDLVPLLWRLPSQLPLLDPDERQTVGAILALAENGHPDRPGLLATMVLGRAIRPSLLAPTLLDLAPAALRRPLQAVADAFLAHHRADLERRITASEMAECMPLGTLADELWRLADALVGVDGRSLEAQKPDTETTALRQRAAAVASERYALSIARVLAPLSDPAAALPAAVKAREVEARRLARLGRAARRLAPDSPIERLTEAALGRMLQPGPSGDRPIGIDDARLVEILLGPDAAWQLLRPQLGKVTPPSDMCRRHL